MQESLFQLGAVAVLFAVAIREFFGYIKVRRENQNGHGGGMNIQILKELQTMNNNHLSSLKQAIENGNSRLIDAIHQDNTKIIELLGEIKGNLNQRR